uniref:Uncharacterized protein n=1 Tax=Oryzias latipes TaxID=8090 RepID=A0A3P9HZ51_ORYLA
LTPKRPNVNSFPAPLAPPFCGTPWEPGRVGAQAAPPWEPGRVGAQAAPPWEPGRVGAQAAPPWEPGRVGAQAAPPGSRDGSGRRRHPPGSRDGSGPWCPDQFPSPPPAPLPTTTSCRHSTSSNPAVKRRLHPPVHRQIVTPYGD